jgi:hypothetical protein
MGDLVGEIVAVDLRAGAGDGHGAARAQFRLGCQQQRGVMAGGGA